MGLFICATDLRADGLGPVEALTPVVNDLSGTFADDPRIRGVMALATCNRIEFVIESHPLPDGRDRTADDAHDTICAIAKLAPTAIRVHRGAGAVVHLFEVAAGLNSVVLGEREIAGQMRRALNAARDADTASTLLTRTVEAALQTSRRVARLTNLSRHGRSVVSVGLDLVAEVAGAWPPARVLLVGTGAYAGTSIAALRARGVDDIAVYSSSGRAASFADSHGVRPAGDLTEALTTTDLVVACSGSAPLTADAIVAASRATPLVVLDLAIGGDVTPEAAALPGVQVTTLADISLHAPTADHDEVARARGFVHEGVHDLALELDRRRMAPAVSLLHGMVADQVTRELDDLPADGMVPVAEVAERIRRLATRMVHVPSRRAREAAESGRGEEFVIALAEVLGVDIDLAAPSLDADDLIAFTRNRCPVTGIALDDLTHQEQR